MEAEPTGTVEPVEALKPVTESPAGAGEADGEVRRAERGVY